jgi:tyrosyl-tRNA synthetase
MWDYYRLLLLKTEDEVKALQSEHPMELKKRLAATLTSKIHGDGTGEHERGQFEKVFSQNQRPDDMPSFSWDELAEEESQSLLNLLGNSKLVASKKEARRLIQQGSVKVNDEKETDPFRAFERSATPLVIQAGKRVFFEVAP